MIVKNLQQIYANYSHHAGESVTIEKTDRVYGHILRRKANTYLKALFAEEELILATKFPHLYNSSEGDIRR